MASRAARNAAALDAQTAVENPENEENTVSENTVAETETAERVKRTPAERAQLRLDTARKRATKAQARLDKLKAGIGSAERELNRAMREVQFRLTDEDLPEQPAAVQDGNVEDTDGSEAFEGDNA